MAFDAADGRVIAMAFICSAAWREVQARARYFESAYVISFSALVAHYDEESVLPIRSRLFSPAYVHADAVPLPIRYVFFVMRRRRHRSTPICHTTLSGRREPSPLTTLAAALNVQAKHFNIPRPSRLHMLRLRD